VDGFGVFDVWLDCVVVVCDIEYLWDLFDGDCCCCGCFGCVLF